MTDKILMLGAGRMGGALLKGWALKDAVDPAHVLVRDPNVSPEIAASGAFGAAVAGRAQAPSALRVWRSPPARVSTWSRSSGVGR